MFLFNQEVGKSKVQQRPLMQQLTDALVAKRQENPQIQVVLITDPINSVYGGIAPTHYAQLRQAGIQVIETDLKPLRASNPLWSGFWYICCQDLGNNPNRGWLNNPFGEQKITLRSYLSLFNLRPIIVKPWLWIQIQVGKAWSLRQIHMMVVLDIVMLHWS